MKKVISLLMSFILIFTALVPAYAADMSAKLTPSATEVEQGEEFTVALNVTCGDKISSGAVEVTVSDKFTVTNGEWDVSGAMLSDYGVDTGKGVCAFSSAKVAEGDIFTLTLKAKNDATGSGDITIKVTYKNGSKVVGEATATTTVSIKTPACAHNNVETLASVAATCTTDGKTEGKVCKDCGAVLVEQKTVAKLGHNFNGEMKDNNDGTHSYKCTNDGCSEYGKTAAHSGDWACNDTQHWKECACGTKIETGDHTGGTATCTKKAVCSECGKEYGELAAHTEVTDAAKAPTCTETGLTAGKHCSVCGEVLVKQEVVAALGHGYGEWTETKAPNCTEAGEKACTCATCGDTKTEAIAALGHSYGEWTETKAPTCTEAGEKTCTCATCGDVKTEAIPALGHTTEGEWTETKAPTCTEAGVKTNTCTICEATVEEAIPALGHDFKDGKCTVCGAADPNFKPADNTKPADTTKPETGDAGIAVWVTLLAVTALFGTAIVVKKRHA